MMLVDSALPNVRLVALAVILPTRFGSPFPSFILHSLRRSLPNFHKEVNPKHRNEFIALMRTVLERLNTVITRLSKSRLTELNGFQSEPNSLLNDHVALLNWYYSYLVLQLHPGSPYQSHITALKILLYFEHNWDQSLSTPPQKPIITTCPPLASLIRALIDLLFDPFEDVRLAANALLERFITLNRDRSSGWLKVQDMRDQLYSCLYQGEDRLRRSVRADNSDGLARVYNTLSVLADTSIPDGEPKQLDFMKSLQWKLNTEIEKLSGGLFDISKISCLHGLIIAWRYFKH